MFHMKRESCGGADYTEFSLYLMQRGPDDPFCLMFYVKLVVSRKTSMPMHGANAGFGGGF